MSLKEELKKGAVEAAKARDQVRLDALRMASSALHYKEIEKRSPLEEAEEKAILSTLCKQRVDSIVQFEKGGRADLVAKEKRELEILQSFLPAQLSREQVVIKARQVIESLGARTQKEMWGVMKALLKEIAGQADGTLVSSVVKELLK